MKHWRPDSDTASRLPVERRARRRDWSDVSDYAPPRPHPRHRIEAKRGTWVGLIIVGLIAAVLAMSAWSVLKPIKPVDKSVKVELVR